MHPTGNEGRPPMMVSVSSVTVAIKLPVNTRRQDLERGAATLAWR